MAKTPLKTFTVEEAAPMLGLSVYGVRYRYYVSKTLKGEVRGNTLFFTQQQIDDSRRMADERKKGRN